MEMRDGSEVRDDRLGRLVLFDERSRDFPVSALVPSRTPRSYTWRPAAPALDQGSVGACVAYGLATSALMRPAVLRNRSILTTRWLLRTYCAAQALDPWEGTDHRSVCGSSARKPHYGGTATLAGLKVFQAKGFFDEYRWAFGVLDAALGIGHNGPALCGTWWREAMNHPKQGVIRAEGERIGGHFYVVNAIRVDRSNWLDGHVQIRNTWGPQWGSNGSAWLSIREWASLLEEDGECAFAQDRHRDPKALRFWPNSVKSRAPAVRPGQPIPAPA